MYYIYIDEAWRWPIAGPVYVGLVIIQVKKNFMRWWNDIDALPWIDDICYNWYDDSKIISELIREELYEKICNDKKITFSSWSSKSTEVDNKWIVRWIRTAIARALRKYFWEWAYSERKFLQWIKNHASECMIVVDGKTDFHMRKLRWVSVEPIVDGDAKVPMISAASIVAKVERDRYMRKLHQKIPQYEFDAHKGYGTKKHYALIAKYGLSKEHRKSWIKEV